MPEAVRAIHLSDLHRGKRVSAAVDSALVELCASLAPELVIASGDLAHRGRGEQLEEAHALLAALEVPVLAVPGNHDIPYSVPARFTHSRREFERVFDTTEPVLRTANAVAVGLDSVDPWRQQGGRLRDVQLDRASAELRGAPSDSLRIVVFHHHLAGAPWRGLHKLPLRRRDHVLERLAAAGAELVLGGHIHQSTTVEQREILVLDGAAPRPLVLATAPGYGRPRPQRAGEAHGLHAYEWTPSTLAVVTYVWDGTGFVPTARREFIRTTLGD
jgi:3',5'-cyclic AMP phosphodiesterase CpdA